MEFCKETPQLLAVGFFNGTIEVLDISDIDADSFVAKSQRTSGGFDPIWNMKWIHGEKFLRAFFEEKSLIVLALSVRLLHDYLGNELSDSEIGFKCREWSKDDPY